MSEDNKAKPKKATWPISDRARDMEEEKQNTSILGKEAAKLPKRKKGK